MGRQFPFASQFFNHLNYSPGITAKLIPIVSPRYWKKSIVFSDFYVNKVIKIKICVKIIHFPLDASSVPGKCSAFGLVLSRS